MRSPNVARLGCRGARPWNDPHMSQWAVTYLERNHGNLAAGYITGSSDQPSEAAALPGLRRQGSGSGNAGTILIERTHSVIPACG